MYYTHEEGAVKFAKSGRLDMDVVLTKDGRYVPVLPQYTFPMLAKGGELVCQVRWEAKVCRNNLETKPVHNYGEPEL